MENSLTYEGVQWRKIIECVGLTQWALLRSRWVAFIFYVFRVDKTGLAEKNGVRVGDQIIDVNGIPFDNITHVHAVEVLKDKKHLILTLRVNNLMI